MAQNHITVRQRTADRVVAMIAEAHRPGDRLPGEQILAKQLGVSVPTLREALQSLVERRLIERRHGIGTIVLDPALSNAERPVGILVEPDVSHPNTSPSQLAMAVRIQRELEGRRHRTRLFLGRLQPGERSDSPTSQEVVEALAQRTLKALVVTSWTTPHWREQFEEAGIPVVRYGSDCPWGVMIDWEHFVASAVADLHAAGRRKIALLCWEDLPKKLQNIFTGTFARKVRELGLSSKPGWISRGLNPNLEGAGWAAFREIWTSDSTRPDALIVTDDVLFRGALLAMYELQILIPRQIALATLSIEGQPFTGLPPSTLRYEVPVAKIAQRMVDLVEERLAGPPTHPQRIVLPLVQKTPEEPLESEIPSARGDHLGVTSPSPMQSMERLLASPPSHP